MTFDIHCGTCGELVTSHRAGVTPGEPQAPAFVRREPTNTSALFKERTCSNGHQIDSSDLFCGVCGERASRGNSPTPPVADPTRNASTSNPGLSPSRNSGEAGPPTGPSQKNIQCLRGHTATPQDTHCQVCGTRVTTTSTPKSWNQAVVRSPKHKSSPIPPLLNARLNAISFIDRQKRKFRRNGQFRSIALIGAGVIGVGLLAIGALVLANFAGRSHHGGTTVTGTFSSNGWDYGYSSYFGTPTTSSGRSGCPQSPKPGTVNLPFSVTISNKSGRDAPTPTIVALSNVLKDGTVVVPNTETGVDPFAGKGFVDLDPVGFTNGTTDCSPSSPTLTGGLDGNTTIKAGSSTTFDGYIYGIPDPVPNGTAAFIGVAEISLVSKVTSYWIIHYGQYTPSSTTSSPATTPTVSSMSTQAARTNSASTSTSIPCGNQPGTATGIGNAPLECWNQIFEAKVSSSNAVCWFQSSDVTCQMVNYPGGKLTFTFLNLSSVESSTQALKVSCNMQSDCPPAGNPEGGQVMPAGSKVEAAGIRCLAIQLGVTCTRISDGKGFTLTAAGYTPIN